MRLFQSIFGKNRNMDSHHNHPEEHSEEITSIVKLISGDELIGKVITCDEGYLIDTPFQLKAQVINTPNGEMFKVDLVPWLKFAKDEIFLLEKSKVFTVCEADERIKKLYNSTFRKYYLGDHATNKVDLSTYEGKIGSVEKTRKDLESLYHKDST